MPLGCVGFVSGCFQPDTDLGQKGGEGKIGFIVN